MSAWFEPRRTALKKLIDSRRLPVLSPAADLALLARLKAKARTADRSFGGEAEQIATYLKRLNLRSGSVVDIAASDGVTLSCTIQLFRQPQWSGLAVEFDATKFSKLAYVYREFTDVNLARCKVTPDNVVSLLSANEIPKDFTVLNLDIDSYDLFVMAALIDGGYRPRLVSMEINEKIPPPLFFTVRFDPNHGWPGDHFYGCSIVAAAETLGQRGYVLAELAYNNAIFVEQDAALAAGIVGKTAVEAYDSGYRNRPERAELFPWNADVDPALGMEAQQAEVFFSEKFKAYEGLFELHHSGGSHPS
jgi:hypothetical protein